MVEKSRLRRTISKWANNSDQHARDLRAQYVGDGDVCAFVGEQVGGSSAHSARGTGHDHNFSGDTATQFTQTRHFLPLTIG